MFIWGRWERGRSERVKRYQSERVKTHALNVVLAGDGEAKCNPKMPA